jgi:hypothetical protein
MMESTQAAFLAAAFWWTGVSVIIGLLVWALDTDAGDVTSPRAKS